MEGGMKEIKDIIPVNLFLRITVFQEVDPWNFIGGVSNFKNVVRVDKAFWPIH